LFRLAARPVLSASPRNPPGLAAAQLPSSNAFVLIRILHRGLSFRQFTPVPGTHQRPLRTALAVMLTAEQPARQPVARRRS
jgi:hypothetical protein